MSVSYVKKVEISENQYVGTNQVQTGDMVSIDYPNTFIYSSDTNRTDLQVERIQIQTVIVGEGAIDDFGSVYGGIFKLDRNVNGYAISISDVTDAQAEIIRNSLSIVENIDHASKKNNLRIDLNRIPLIAHGISNFRMSLPVSETSIDLAQYTQLLDALSVTVNANYFVSDPVLNIVGDNTSKILNISTVVYNSVPTVRFSLPENQYTESITSAILSYSISSSTLLYYDVTRDYSVYNLNFRFGSFPILNNTMTVQNRTDWNGSVISEVVSAFRNRELDTFSNYSNYVCSFGFDIYRHEASSPSVSGEFVDASTTRRVAYNITYGIGDTSSGQIQSIAVMKLGLNSTSPANMVFDTDRVIVNYNVASSTNQYIINFYFNNNSEPINYVGLVNDGSGNYALKVATANYEWQSTYFAGTVDVLSFINAVNQEMRLNNWANNNLYCNYDGRPGLQDTNYEAATSSNKWLGFAVLAGYETVAINTLVLNATRTAEELSSQYNSFGNYNWGYSFSQSTGQSVGSRQAQFLYIKNSHRQTIGDFIDFMNSLDVGCKITQYVPLFDYVKKNNTYVVDKTSTQSWRNLPFYGVLSDGVTIKNFDVGGRQSSTNSSYYAVATIYSLTNGLLNVNENSAANRSENVANQVWPISFTTTAAATNTVTEVAAYITDTINSYIQQYFATVYNSAYLADSFNSLRIDIDDRNIDANIASTYIDLEPTVTNTAVSPFVYSNVTYSSYRTITTNYATNKNVYLTGIENNTYTFDVGSAVTLQNLIDSVRLNDDTSNILTANLTNNEFANLNTSTIEVFQKNLVDIDYIINTTYPTTYNKAYDLNQFANLYNLAEQVNSDFSNNIFFEVNQIIDNYPQTLPKSLVNVDINNLTTSNLQVAFLEDYEPAQVSAIINYEFDIFDFAVDSGNNNSGVGGVQVALGGYEKDGIFYSYDAPNSFFEPNFNTLFPIEFVTTQADVAYLLVRTGKRLTNSIYIYENNPICYAGQVTYDNDSPSRVLTGVTPTNTEYISAWQESFGLPVVFAVPLKSVKNSVTIDDICNLDSLHLTIVNLPSSLRDVYFLAINKNNINTTQKESKAGLAFGLVLDSVGAWDVLISPSGALKQDDNGTIYYDGKFYTREVVSYDESYTMTIESINSAYSSAVTIMPVPNNPQIWALKISPIVKQILLSQTNRSDPNSLNGCNLDVNIKILGNSSLVETNIKVKIYRDYTCVYDIGLCDFYWNLIDPPQTATQATQVIQNKLDIQIEEILNCDEALDTDQSALLVKQNLLLTIKNIPTFSNGNALLLIKSNVDAVLQSFYFPSSNALENFKYKNCSFVTSNGIVASKLNKEFLLLPNRTDPITDASDIQALVAREKSYLYMRPQFQFPIDDNIKDCGSNELVIVGLGYQFKNWSNGYRTDYVAIGLNFNFASDTYSTPAVNLCNRYYFSLQKS